MQGLKRDDFNARREAAEAARNAMLARFRAQPGPDDPVVQQRLAEQRAVAEAREKRRAEREAERVAQAEAAAAEAVRLAAEEAARQVELARLAAEQAALEAEAAREAATAAMEQEERAAMLDSEKKARALALAAEQKALRDARYAARKARRKSVAPRRADPTSSRRPAAGRRLTGFPHAKPSRRAQRREVGSGDGRGSRVARQAAPHFAGHRAGDHAAVGRDRPRGDRTPDRQGQGPPLNLPRHMVAAC